MKGKYESLEKILSAINDKKGLNKDNIIEEIKTELEKQDQDLYEEWEKGGFDVNHGFSLNISGREYSKLPLLIIAARNGYTKTVEILLENGADVNAKDQDDKTSLHYAAANDHIKTVEILLENGADVNAKDQDGWTSLHYAAANDHIKTVEILLENGADVNAKDQDDKTSLHHAAYFCHEKIVEALIEGKADVNAVDRYGWTPLDYAKDYDDKYCAIKSQNVVKTLLEAAFLKARNKAMIAGGVTTLLGTAIAVALFTTGIITAQLVPIVISVVAIAAAALVVGGATYMFLKPSTEVGEIEKSSAFLTKNETVKKC